MSGTAGDALPPGWARAKLDDLRPLGAPIIYGILQPGPDLSDGVPYVRPTEISDGQISNELRRTSPAIAEKYRRSTLAADDVVMSIVGTIGKVAVVPPELAGANITQSSCRIRPDTQVLERDYLRHMLKAQQLTTQYDRHRLGTGVPRLNLAHVRELDAPLAPLNEQRRIVAKIDALQAHSRRAREALDAIPALLERFRQSVLAAAFRGDLTADWRAANPDVEPASVLLERIRVERKARWIEANAEKSRARAQARAEKKGKPWGPADDEKALAAGRKKAEKKYAEPEPVDPDSLQVPELPPRWAWSTVEALCWDGPSNGYSGRTSQSASGTLTMKLSATSPGRMVLDESTTKRLLEHVAADSGHWLEVGDLLVQRANSLELLGSAAVFRGHAEPLIYPDLMMRLRSSSEPVTEWLWRFFNGPTCREYFRASATGTAGNMPKINGAILRETLVPVPPKAELYAALAKVTESLGQADGAREATKAASARIDTLEQSVLARAFRGELVPQDPDDEPASVLLDRIRAEREAASPKKRERGRR